MKLSTVIRQIQKEMPELELLQNEPLSRHCSFRIGGPAAALALPKGQEELEYLCQLLASFAVEPLLIGKGTNLLISDAPLDLFVIKLGEGLSQITRLDDTGLYAEAGVTLAKLATTAAEWGLSGLEFAHGIPGTLGGAVAMNAGAYGGEMRDVVTAVDFLDSDQERFRLPAEELGFAYRRSVFSDTDAVILGAQLRLQPGDPAEIRARMKELAEKRRSSQPLELPSAGSTFKRPATGYAAAMIDQCGLKGYRVGDAMVSEKHAGFVVNAGNASFSDVLAVMEYVQEQVRQATGVELEPEVKIILPEC